MATRPHIVIVGGGAGGLELATRLGDTLGRRQQAQITLVDVHNTHFWKPLLHEVATGALNASDDELSYLAQAAWHHFRFIPGCLVSLNRAQKTLGLAAIHDDAGNEVVPPRTLTYDTLVIAVGSTVNDFNTPGVQQHCLFLDNRQQAERIHTTLMHHYLRAQATGNHTAQLRIAIVGAGATGIELAAALHYAAIALARYGLNAIKQDHVTLTLIEGSERILPALPSRISASIHAQLTRMGIHIMTQQLVSKVVAEGLYFRNGDFMATDLIIWAAGIKAPAFLATLDGLATNALNQLIVRPTLQTQTDDNLYALGDCAYCQVTDTAGKPFVIPPRAQTAHQQATALAKSLMGVVAGRSPLPFHYRDYGSLISLSRFSAIGYLMGRITGDKMIEGVLAKLFYIGLYRMHQITLFGKLKTGALILKDCLNKTTRPRLKLH